MKNNKGLSYVELLVVIGVMVLLTGISALSIGLASRTNATKCADKLVTSLKTARTYSLAKGSEKGAFHIAKQGNNYVCGVGDLADNPQMDVIGSHPILIYYYVDGAGLMPLVESVGTITIKFDQSSGAVTSCNIGSNIIDAFVIYQANGGEPVARVTLHELTGKSELTLE